MVVDSGATFTMLLSDTFAQVANEFVRAMASMPFTRTEDVEQTGLSLCHQHCAEVVRVSSEASLPLSRCHGSLVPNPPC
ncbi:hypothetical protein E2562_015551 [Oryza meyeriana var. granulata]|uniref:Uncharacterized protein n=1 Tax=Oryza meyeriana var. granulata TaxID=110450 RepID=A0A6G1CGA4_9ORYZ|nr:hypothetical protein E2562_015551 [Oryza meyeriana var. granulata]